MNPSPIEQETAVEQPTETRGDAQWARILKGIFSRHLMDMAILALIPVILSGIRNPAHTLADPDIWWHLADARVLDQTHHFIHVEPYSFTVTGQRWIDPEWLSEMPFWLGYRIFGLVGVYLVTWLALSANLHFVYWRGFLRSKNPGVALWMAALGFVLMWVNANARTILFGYLAMSAELCILDAVERGGRRVIWLLPPLFCLWVNLHGSWFIGLGLLGLYILCGLFRVDAGIFRQEPFSRDERNRWLSVFGVSLAALMVNPYGWRLVWNPLDMALNQTLNIGNVQEWQPLNLGWVVGKAAVAFIALTLFTNVMHARKWKIYEMAFVFFAWYAAFDHARFTFMAAVIAIPMIAADLTRSFFPTQPNPRTIPVMNGVVAAAVLGVVALYFPSRASLQEGLATEFPLQTIASIQPSWRTLNHEHLGGIMDFNGKPTFIDTRWDTFEHHGVMKDFIDVFHSQNSLALLDKYRVDHVLLRKSEPICYWLERTPQWKVVRTEGTGKDDQYELFARVH
ncbi:MAG: hypothetical protein WCC26_12890 [Terracidiphilus sp.]